MRTSRCDACKGAMFGKLPTNSQEWEHAPRHPTAAPPAVAVASIVHDDVSESFHLKKKEFLATARSSP